MFTTDGGRPVVVGTSTSWAGVEVSDEEVAGSVQSQPVGAERVMAPVETGVSVLPPKPAVE